MLFTSTFEAIAVPMTGAVFEVIVPSAHELVTRSTLKLPGFVTPFTNSFRVAWLRVAPAGTEARLN